MNETKTSVNKSVVTGAAGFVGRNLVDALVARGDEVVAVDMGPAYRSDVRWIQADIRDEDAMRDACEGADVVFHNASIVHTRKNREHDVWSINHDGSRAVLEAAQAAGTTRFVYVSTASAVYEGRDIEFGDETMPYSRVSQAPYADSKIAAEKLILAADGHAGMQTCAIRPHVVFGPGDTRFLPAILEKAEAGKLKFGVGWTKKLSDFTYVSNLIDALLLADEALRDPKSEARGEAFFITNAEPRRFFGFVGQILEEMGLPAIKGSVPYAVAWTAAAVAEGIDTLRGGTLGTKTGMSRFAVRYICTHHYFSVDKARRILGYEPAVDLDRGIRLTVEALRAARAAA